MTAEAFYQGEPGCFSEAAAVRWRPDVALHGVLTLKDVFTAVVSPDEQFGVVPYHNTIAGDVPGTAELLDDPSVHIVHRLDLPVEMALLVLPGTALSDIEAVMSHPVALDQCRPYLDELSAVAVPVHDTAGAARLLAERKPVGTAAIAPARAASIYGLDILADGIQSRTDNVTRFAVFTRRR